MKKAILLELLETIAGLFIMAGGISIVQQSPVTTVLCVLLGIVIIPFSKKYISEKYKKTISPQVRTILIYVLTLTIALTFKTVSPQTDALKEWVKNANVKETTNTVKNDQEQISKEGPYEVVKVIDGDTIEVLVDQKPTKIRVIGLDTPETVDPRKKVECFGKEASLAATKLLENKNVYLEKDPSQSDIDKYGRLLRYVLLEDGTNFSKYMLENGFGHEYTYDTPYKYQSEFKAAQKSAEAQKTGLWAEGACPNN